MTPGRKSLATLPRQGSGWLLPPEVRGRQGRRIAWLTAAFLVLTSLVAAGAAKPLDAGARDALRPNGEWGRAQQLMNPMIDALAPSHVLPLCLAVAVVASLLHRSIRPLVATTALMVLVSAAAFVTKFLVARPDPSGDASAIGGSYPSGHVLSLLVVSGLVLLLLWKRPPALVWAVVAAPAAAMGYALVLCSAHWLTDVLGGLVLGAIALVVAHTARFAEALNPARTTREPLDDETAHDHAC